MESILVAECGAYLARHIMYVVEIQMAVWCGWCADSYERDIGMRHRLGCVSGGTQPAGLMSLAAQLLNVAL